MALNRGDIVVGVASRDYGKPRPALVVQSNLYNPTHASVTICPVTSHLIDAPLFRVALPALDGTGLKADSQIMIDKIASVPVERIGRKIGHIPTARVKEVDAALALWLGLQPANR